MRVTILDMLLMMQSKSISNVRVRNRNRTVCTSSNNNYRTCSLCKNRELKMMPIYRAKKLGTKNEYVEGYLKTCTDTGKDIWIQSDDLWLDSKIDTSTLEISFDGKSFYKIKEVEARVNYCEKLTDTTH